MGIFWIVVLFAVLNSSLVSSESKDEQLLNAATQGNTQKIQSLLTEGANINSVNRYGETPLYLACSHQHIEAASLLIEKGADVRLKNQFGGSPLERAAAHDLATVVLSLLKNGADVNGVNNEGDSALMVACARRHEGVAELLLANGANPNIANSVKTTPLMEASVKGLVDTVKLLIEKGAIINAINRMNQTVLHVLATNRNSYPRQRYEVIRILLEKGADINAKDNEGKTAYESAKYLGYPEISELKPKESSEIGNSEIARMKADISYLKAQLREEKTGNNLAKKLSDGLLSGLEDAEKLIQKFETQLRSLIKENEASTSNYQPSSYVTPDTVYHDTDAPNRYHAEGSERPILNKEIGYEDRYKFDERYGLLKSGSESNYATFFANCILVIVIQMFVNA